MGDIGNALRVLDSMAETTGFIPEQFQIGPDRRKPNNRRDAENGFEQIDRRGTRSV